MSRPARARDDRLVGLTSQSTGDAPPERGNAVGPTSDMWMDPAADPRFAAPPVGHRGNWTSFRKKSSICLIAVINCSKSTGLLTYALACRL